MNATPTESSGSLIISQQPPSTEDGYAACVFDINWERIRFRKGVKAMDTGELGWRIGHRKQIGGRGVVGNIWSVGADLMYRQHGETRETWYWLCEACCMGGVCMMGFYEASWHKSIYAHLLKEHSLNAQLKKAGTKSQPVNRLLVSMSQHFDTANNSSLSPPSLTGSSFTAYISVKKQVRRPSPSFSSCVLVATI